MAIDYAGLADVAQELIEDNGRTATLVKVSEVPADASQPWRGNTSIETTQVVSAVFLDYMKEDIDGDLVRNGDQRAFIAEKSAPGIDFQDYEILRDDEDQEWKIIDVDKKRPGPTTIVFILQLRK